jgi:hypothetical protein
VGRTFLSDAFELGFVLAQSQDQNQIKGIPQTLPRFAEAPSKAKEEVERSLP